MKARAPGKVVLSGAYAVLEGAPALVTAVDRYALVDTNRSGTILTEEMRAAGIQSAPLVDASALRQDGRKLGLGSSAAILVAALAAFELDERPDLDDERLAENVFVPALIAHRKAQGGGSGIDVAAAAFGGTRLAHLSEAGLQTESTTLPDQLELSIWATGVPASTGAMLAAVLALRKSDPGCYRSRIRAQADAAERAAGACVRGDAPALVLALAEQLRSLNELGLAARAPIVSSQILKWAQVAARQDAALLPAGAGGGDVLVHARLRGATSDLSGILAASGLKRLDLRLAARGVHAILGTD